MGEIESTFRCSMPGCVQQITVNSEQPLRDFNWFGSVGGSVHLCPFHRHSTVGDLWPDQIELAAGNVVAQIDAAFYPAGLGLERERLLRSALVDFAAEIVAAVRHGAAVLVVGLVVGLAGCSSETRVRVVDGDVAAAIATASGPNG